jgi:hypothetical protein
MFLYGGNSNLENRTDKLEIMLSNMVNFNFSEVIYSPLNLKQFYNHDLSNQSDGEPNLLLTYDRTSRNDGQT